MAWRGGGHFRLQARFESCRVVLLNTHDSSSVEAQVFFKHVLSKGKLNQFRKYIMSRRAFGRLKV